MAKQAVPDNLSGKQSYFSRRLASAQDLSREKAADAIRLERQIAEQERTLILVKKEVETKTRDAERWLNELQPKRLKFIADLEARIQKNLARLGTLRTETIWPRKYVRDLRSALNKIEQLKKLKRELDALEAGTVETEHVVVDAEQERRLRTTTIADVHFDREAPVQVPRHHRPVKKQEHSKKTKHR